MAGASIIFNALNGWVTTTSSAGGPTVAFRRLITTATHLIRIADARM